MKKLLALYCALIVALTGCGKQSAPLEKSIIENSDSSAFHASCPKADFHKQVLDKDNLLNIFSCLGIDKRHPTIFSFIEGLDERGYRALVGELNRTFFKNTESRDKFVQFLRKNLNSRSRERILKSIKSFILAANKYNLYERLKESLRSGSFPLPSGNLFVTLSAFHAAGLDKAGLKNFFQNSSDKKRKSETEAILLEIASKLAERPEVFKELAVFFEELRSFDKAENLSRKEFFRLFEFIAALDDNTYKSIARVEKDLSSAQGNCSQSLSYSINHAVEIEKQMDVLAYGSFEEFYQTFFDLNLKYSLFLNVCEQEKVNEKIRNVLNAAREFLKLKGSYTLARSYLLSQEKSPSKMTSKEGNWAFRIFNLAGSPFCLKSRSFLEKLRVENELKSFTDMAYDFLKTFKGEKRGLLVDAMNAAGDEKQFFDFSARLLKNLKNAKKADFSNFMLVETVFGEEHLEAITFFAKIEENYPNLLSNLNLNLIEQRANFGPLLEQVQTFLSDDVNLFLANRFLESEDFERLFSILSQLPTKQVPQIKPSNISPAKNPPAAIELRVLNKDSKVCFEKLERVFDQSPDFWSVLPNYPAQCYEVFQPTISKKVFSWTVKIDENFFEFSNKKFSVPYGVISKDMMKFYMSMMLAVNELVETSDATYVERIVKKIKQQLFDEGLLSSFEAGLGLLTHSPDSEALVSQLLLSVSEMSSEEFAKARTRFARFEKPFGGSRWSLSNGSSLNPRVNSELGVEESLELARELFDLLAGQSEGYRLADGLIDFLNPNKG
ncbi:MAG: hypothetical protein WD025_06515, partial [Bacteriovoracaceae bacterium]